MHSFRLPTEKVVAVVMQIVCGGHHVLPAGMDEYQSLMCGMHQQLTGMNKQLYVTLADISNYFWSLRLPQKAVGCFKVIMVGLMYTF